MSATDDPDWRVVYDTLYPYRGRAKKKHRREQSDQSATGFLYPRRREPRPDMDALERQFIEEMEAIGRGDIADDDSESFVIAFDRWLKKKGLE